MKKIDITEEEVLDIEINTSKEETIKGRKEDDYFFPKERVTIKASSLQNAIKKLKELK